MDCQEIFTGKVDRREGEVFTGKVDCQEVLTGKLLTLHLHRSAQRGRGPTSVPIKHFKTNIGPKPSFLVGSHLERMGRMPWCQDNTEH